MRAFVLWSTVLIVAGIAGTLLSYLLQWLGWPIWIRLPAYVLIGACVGSTLVPVILKRLASGE